MGGGHGRVLLVAPDGRRDDLHRQLSGIGLDPTAVTPADAIEIALSTDASVGVIDVASSEGLMVLEDLRVRCGDGLYLLALSHEPGEQSRLDVLRRGARALLPMPIPPELLAAELEVGFQAQAALAEARASSAITEQLRLYSAEAGALLAHDLRNGLSVALSEVQFLSETMNGLDGDQRAAVRAAEHAIERMDRLVRNFVEIGRQRGERIEARRVPSMVARLVERAVRVHHRGPRSEHCELEVDVPTDLEASIDPPLFERVLHNLLVNAFRYVSPGGVIRVHARQRLEPKRLQVEVANTGTAIPEPARDHLFSRRSRLREYEGMGLYFCRLACEAHGGSISYDYRQGLSVFEVELSV